MLQVDRKFSLIVFGASGHLAKLKIFPSIYEMALEGRLKEDYNVFGFARTEMSQEEFRNLFKDSILSKYPEPDFKILDAILQNVHYFAADYSEELAYKDFLDFIGSVEAGDETFLRMAYFAVPPTVFEPILKGLAANFDHANLRLILEKPFGSDYESAKNLKKLVKDNFSEEQVFMLDHYLGKEGVFNLLSLRYANSIFSYLLQGKYISNIQVSALEEAGLEGRAGYFDVVGTMNDMIQSHLFQILTFLTMSIPRKFDVELIHKAKTQALQNLYFDPSENSVFVAQYAGYLSEAGVKKNSLTDTYAALKLKLDVPGWEDVPIYLRSGKKMKQKWTGVVVEFKPHENQSKLEVETVNRLLIQIQPQEKVEFYMYTKKGGEELEFVPLNTGKPIYCSGDCLSEHSRLLMDVILGNKLLFLDFGEILASWSLTDKINSYLADNVSNLSEYVVGSYGPEEANKLLEVEGHSWFNKF